MVAFRLLKKNIKFVALLVAVKNALFKMISIVVAQVYVFVNDT
ncbi:hypothetical protein M8C21_008014 [Ambrosia artemisiifolia]|uniref:Uncharacterized protein n=1 Tax=Ambrosia artemisiifolia TaxID=4212 RepID=A0AAD5G3K4_AMBAR|nr:hypothetical protein M8C21_008014 [Ambrosia artemisiifolia]